MDYAVKNNGQYESIVFNSWIIQTHGRNQITLQAKIDDNQFADYKVIPAANTVTKLDIPIPADLRLVSKYNFDYTIPFVPIKYFEKHIIEDYLYDITYGKIDYDYAYENFNPSNSGGCSSIRNGCLVGRNFDWLYDQEVQFVVHTPTSFNSYAVLGVASIIPGVNKNNAGNSEIIIDGLDMHKMIPFYLVDGINERGVFCNMNIVPLDNKTDPTQYFIANKEELHVVCAQMLPRFILDRFATAKQAVDYIVDYVTVYFTDSMLSSGYQCHLMIGDCSSNYIVEFINGEVKVICSNYMTNFNIDGVQFDKYHKIIYPPTQYGMDQYGAGLERWDIIADNYGNSNNYDGMRSLLEKLCFSNAYNDEAFWYSELVKGTDDDGGVITADTPPEKCQTLKALALQQFDEKDRDDPKVWITCHASIYDINRKVLYIRNQENKTDYTFNI